MVLSTERRTALERHLLVSQDLSTTTVRKTLNSLAIMERHGFDLEHPTIEAYEDFIARRKRDGARGTALQHYYKATLRLLRWHGQRRWEGVRCPRAPAPKPQISSDDLVRALMSYGLYDPDDLELATARFCFTFGHYTALRAPSEHVALGLEDFDRHTRKLWVWSEKVDRGRYIRLEPWLRDIVVEYIDGVRAKVDRGWSSSLILNPGTKPKYTGLPWRADAYRMWLTRHGRQIDAGWHPRLMRHWGLTYRLIHSGMNLMAVQEYADHSKADTTRKYVHVATAVLDELMSNFAIQPLPPLPPAPTDGDAPAAPT